MFNLKIILKDVKKDLIEKTKLKEEIQTNVRKATRLSKQAILFIHQKEIEKSQESIEAARKLILKFNEMIKDCPEVIQNKLFSSAFQEYCEASLLLKLMKDTQFLTPKEIKVSSIDYVLGLADVIGEYRRIALDSLREGNVEKSERSLRIMEEIYVEISALDEAYMLVPGLRRKCDSARRIIETTRGDVTQEVRRSFLINQLKDFKDVFQKKRDNIN